MKKIVLSSFILMSIFLLANSVSAAVLGQDAAESMMNNSITIKNASGLASASVGSIVATIIQAGLGLLAIIFLVLMIIAGFQWMTAAGNETKVENAVGRIKTAIIGLVIVLAAYSITYFIFTYLPFSGSGLQPDTTDSNAQSNTTNGIKNYE